MKTIRLIIVFSLLLSAFGLHAQKTLVTGLVIDSETKEPVPFANVYFKDSKIGTTTDVNGNYRIETYYATDSLVASTIGYQRLAKRVKADQSQVVDFEIGVSGIALEMVTVKADKKKKDPAIELMKKVIRNKAANNRVKLDYYEYNVYNKIEFDMNNIDESFTERRVMKPFQFVFENIDSTSEDKPFLPIFLTESYSRYFYRKSPKATKELIEATKVAGVQNESVSQFLGDMYQGTNVYDNYITVFGKSFVSPLSDFGQVSYKYYLLDSAVLNEKYKCYQIAFVPRRKGELVFEGEMWINDTTYAVKQIQASVKEDANINWVNAFSVYHEYDQVEDEVWMLTKEKVVIDFNVAEKSVGFYGRKTTMYNDFEINKAKDDDFYSVFNNIEVSEDANEQSDEYWQEKRPEKLSDKEQSIYTMVDTIKDIPAFRTYVDVITLVITGYYEMKYVDLGPYFTVFSFNQIEGPRFRVGGKTNSDFSTKMEFGGYVAYGLRDEQFKYQAEGRFFLSKRPRQIIHGSYRKDLEQLGQSANAWRTDNILASVFRRSPNNQLNAFEEYKVDHEIEYFPGFSSRLIYNRRDIWSPGQFLLTQTDNEGNTNTVNRISTSEVSLTLRLAYQEKFITGELDRISLGTKYPIIQANIALGIKGFLGGEYEYQRAALSVQDNFSLNPFGQSDLRIEVGKIWGRLPFPLLQLFNGNETYFYDAYAFNLMNFYEFVGDRWMTVSWVHHYNGLFFNKVPLLRKLKWREVTAFRCALGELRSNHEEELDFPNGLSTLRKPYFEASAGIENIFKIIRVDALWRLSYLNKPDAVPFGIRVGFQIDF